VIVSGSWLMLAHLGSTNAVHGRFAVTHRMRVGPYLLVLMWPMVQDRNNGSASETGPEDAGEGSPQVVFGLALEDLA
jgi:hypothetical protein